MSRRTWAALLLGLALTLTTVNPLVVQAAPLPAATAHRVTQLSTADFATKLLALINARRKQIGCPVTKASPKLAKAARGHTQLMKTDQQLSHQLPNEPGLVARVVHAGYKKWSALAENVAWGVGSPTSIYNLWMGSTEHRDNIQRCVYRDAGIGVVYDQDHTWVTLDLGRHR